MTRVRYDKNIHLMRLCQVQDRVAGDVLLLDHGLMDVYLALQCGTKREDIRTFHLLRNFARVNHRTAINTSLRRSSCLAYRPVPASMEMPRSIERGLIASPADLILTLFSCPCALTP